MIHADNKIQKFKKSKKNYKSENSNKFKKKKKSEKKIYETVVCRSRSEQELGIIAVG